MKYFTGLITFACLVSIQLSGVSHAALQMFWTQRSSTGGIWRANPDGSDPIEVISGLTNPNELIVNTSVGKMFWVEANSPDTAATTIKRANIDGTQIENVYTGDGSLTAQLAVDSLNKASGQMNFTKIEVS